MPTAECYAACEHVSASFARVATIVLTVAYPILVYVGLTQWSTRGVAIALIVLAVLLMISRAQGLAWSRVQGAMVPLLPTILGAVVAGVTAEGRVLLAVPVLVNLGLLATFAATLRPERMPMIERFARLQEAQLSVAQQAHCRQVTWVWCGFFVANAIVSGLLAVLAPMSWWAAWCGGLAYGCIGLLFAGEWVVRRRRFGAKAVAS
jgi:uncharacterized membrane protein